MNSVRKTIDITEELQKTIEKMADAKNWSFSYMCFVLLQQAVKEKNRKKKSANAKNNSTNHPDNMGKSNGQ